MALKDIWIDQNNEIDDADAEVINNIAHAVIDLEKKGSSSGGAVSSVNKKTGDVVLTASDVGAYTKSETTDLIKSAINSSVPELSLKKAEKDLSNVSNEDFLAKLNEVLPDGDEVSY